MGASEHTRRLSDKTLAVAGLAREQRRTDIAAALVVVQQALLAQELGEQFARRKNDGDQEE